MTDKLLVLTTTGSEAEAGRIAQALVERRVAACVNIIPRIQSVYRWNEKVEKSEEFLLFIKTTRLHEQEVRETVRQMHSYKLPEHIAISIDSGSQEYLKWVDESVGG
jgi:periplasmic divalent cation tolerance protein